MNTELHKMAEIAADYSLMSLANTIKTNIEDIYEKAIEIGYKEAIEKAKEWLETHIANQVETREAEGNLMTSKDAFLADFEADMLKLWEDEK